MREKIRMREGREVLASGLYLTVQAQVTQTQLPGNDTCPSFSSSSLIVTSCSIMTQLSPSPTRKVWLLVSMWGPGGPGSPGTPGHG